jgi:Fe-Mn family superoxide dismutase
MSKIFSMRNKTFIKGVSMEHVLQELPFAEGGLAPMISAETIQYHYGKHHAAYVANLNKLVRGTEFEKQSLEELVSHSTGGIFNNAAQAWNHAFYWQCLSPSGGGEPEGALAKAILGQFGTFARFKEEFTKIALSTFGSGWVWLSGTSNGMLTIESTSNAGTPIKDGKNVLLTCDVWEHAYYIDYRNNRAAYLESFWKIVNWKFVEGNMI